MQKNDKVYLIEGSEGDVLEFDNLNIVIPKKPRYKKDILYYNLPKKKQKWVRQDIPKGLTRDNATDYVDYIDEEFRRRRDGLWFLTMVFQLISLGLIICFFSGAK